MKLSKVLAFLTCLCLPIIANAQTRTPQDIANDLDRLATELRLLTTPIQAPAGSNLQSIINNAPAGATISLGYRAEFAGTYILPKSVKLLGNEARITSINGDPALVTNGNDIFVENLRVTGPSHDLIIAAGQYIVFDNILVEGNGNTKRGIRLDGANITVRRSVIHNIYRVGQDSQAIAGWNGLGPYTIMSNYLEAAGENIMFGGADPAVPGTIPSDILIQGNIVSKPLSWKGKGYNIKNLIEFKSARGVYVSDNLFENSWVEAQTGYCVVITPVNQDGKHPAAAVEDLTFEDNEFKNCAAGIQLARNGYILKNVSFVRNLFETHGTGNNKFLLVLGGMDGLKLEYNTILASRQTDASFIYGHEGNVTNFRFFRNLIRVSGDYGICTAGNCNGRQWANFFIGGVIEENAFVNFPSPANLPTSNVFLATTDPNPVGYGR